MPNWRSSVSAPCSSPSKAQQATQPTARGLMLPKAIEELHVAAVSEYIKHRSGLESRRGGTRMTRLNDVAAQRVLDKLEDAEAEVVRLRDEDAWLHDRVKRLGVSHAEKRERVSELTAALNDIDNYIDASDKDSPLNPQTIQTMARAAVAIREELHG